MAKPARPRSARAVIALDIEDPARLSAGAAMPALRAPPAGATSTESDAREWRAPARPRVRVVAAVKGDAALMYARHQIDQASYYACRAYAQL